MSFSSLCWVGNSFLFNLNLSGSFLGVDVLIKKHQVRIVIWCAGPFDTSSGMEKNI